MTPRERLKAKIVALQAKTEANGCTEAEAMGAAAMAARLMAEHVFDQADIEMTEATAAHKWVRSPWREKLSAAIGFVTNCAYVLDLDRHEMVFVGREPGPDIAAYLRDVCFRAVDRAVPEFKQTSHYRRRRKLATRRLASGQFIDGMVIRLMARLSEIFRPVMSAPAREEAKQALMRRVSGQIISTPFKPLKRRASGAAEAGWRAGGDVSLHHGVDGAAAPKLIGGR